MDLPFDESEYRQRVARTREAMEQAGIEVLLVTDPGNMNYLSGYDGWSFYVHQGRSPGGRCGRRGFQGPDERLKGLPAEGG